MRILYNDGEGLEHGDLNLQREISLRLLFDSILANFAAPDQVNWGTKTVRDSEELRPFRHAGALTEFADGDTEVEVFGGLWIQMDYSAALSLDGPTALVGHKDTKETVTGFVAASATTFRRDIVQARIVSADDASVSRDFKDAITGALSTVNQVKRSRLNVEYARKAGAEVASQALADDPTNEVAPDAGWFIIQSVLCDDGGLHVTTDVSTHWDWRKPWGYSSALTRASDWWFLDIVDIFKLSTIAGHNLTNDISGIVFGGCPFDDVQLGNAMFEDYASVRIEKLLLNLDMAVAPLTADVAIYSSELDPTVDFGTKWADLGLLFGTSAGEIQIAGLSTQPPLWSNGRPNPNRIISSDSGQHLLMAIETRAVADKIKYARWLGWGGF